MQLEEGKMAPITPLEDASYILFLKQHYLQRQR